ncbi:PREDICTED: cadherin-86C-like, partial [Nicrophorus vespilloides]|uniref:Cadherin-86C-like n=1 Tax=Nicrophorus vespilloides TaxID=110193 RepID=A0ABM1MR51_NICVS
WSSCPVADKPSGFPVAFQFHAREFLAKVKLISLLFFSFFFLVILGELRLAKPLNEIQAISHSNVPIILTVVAEEVRSSPTEPAAQSTTVRLALIAPQPTASNPRFSSTNFTVDLEENSPPGTILTIPKAEFIAQPGVLFSLTLLNNNGTFAVSPNVIEGRSKFMVKVSDNSLLDFERRRSVVCEILAKELTEGNHTASATLTVRLTDTNDNAPKFPRSEFAADIPENTQPGSSVLKVTASDVDGNDIRFRLLGTGSDHFNINPTTGVITVTQPLDSESIAAYAFQVQAEDNSGNKANATVAINVLDVNDQSPIFEKPFYEFILNQDRRSFTFPAFVKALDKDVSAPNNDVKYEIIGVHENLTLDEVNGELRVQGVWNGKEVGVFKIRAYDGGVPTLWNECEIRIYPPDGNRKMVFIVSGRNRNKADVEQYLSGIVGADVKVDSIRDYDGYNQQGVLDVSESGGERSIVETTVNFASNSVVDLEHIRRILDTKETKDRESKEVVVKAGNPNLWWLLLTLLLLLILIALILILCCIIEGCPLYVAPKRRRKVTPDVEKLVIKDQENKSVQVAEWYGRREAWTPEHNLIEVEVDSIKRHELERGSERGEVRKMSYKNQEVGRDQLYIREGNADILRLITRGGDQQQQQQQRPVTLIPEAYVIDSGKDILMKRFIDQQQTEARASAYQQNTLNRIQSEHELLEASLRQQNALLRQILSEREKDLRLETQSLPAGTQTDQNVSTQTEPLYLRPPRRQTRSDNDASDGSEEEEKYQKSRRRKKLNVKRKIRTPIQEESETEQIVAQTKTSLMRQQLKSNSSSRTKSSRSLRKEVLQEISDSLEPYTDSVEEETPRRNSETGLQRKEIASQLKSSSSHNDLTSKQKQSKRGSSRYMEWYSKKPRRAKVEGGSLETSATKVSKRQLSATQPAQRNVELPIGNGPEHPLIQHSKNRFEVVGLPNEDGDSGIALTRPTMAQKKSVFTIAYDDMQTRQLPESVSTTP